MVGFSPKRCQLHHCDIDQATGRWVPLEAGRKLPGSCSEAEETHIKVRRHRVPAASCRGEREGGPSTCLPPLPEATLPACTAERGPPKLATPRPLLQPHPLPAPAAPQPLPQRFLQHQRPSHSSMESGSGGMPHSLAAQAVLGSSQEGGSGSSNIKADRNMSAAGSPTSAAGSQAPAAYGQTPTASGQTRGQSSAAAGQASGANGQTSAANGQTSGADGETSMSAEGAFDLVLCVRFLNRPLNACMAHLLAPGGHILYNT